MEIVGKPRDERRISPRVQLKEILYVNLDSESGGIVVNLSDSGLSFRCAVPVQRELQTNNPVRLTLLLPQGKEIDVPAEVVWTGQTGKTGGVRFTSLSAAASGHIRDLIDESLPGVRLVAEPSGIPSVLTHREQPAKIELPHLSPLPSQTPLDIHRVAPAAPAEAPAIKTPDPVVPFPNAESYQRTRVKDSWLPPPEEPRSFRGIAAVVLILALLAGAGWLLNSHRHDLGIALVGLGERLKGTPLTQSQPDLHASSAPSATDPSQAPAPPVVVPRPAPPVQPPIEEAASLKPPPSRSPAKGPDTPQPQPPPNASADATPTDQEGAAADLAAAQRYLSGKDRNSAAAAALLWSALAKGGGPTAELTLARLYLSGDGVAKSCEQARVLLKAASNHGDSEAEQTLAQVNRNRCR